MEHVINKRYGVVRRLGSGSMGTVYHVRDRLTGNEFALKQVTSDTLEFADEAGLTLDTMRVALTHEFKLLASMQHPHVIGVQDYGFDESNLPYFTMSLIDTPRTIIEATQKQPFVYQLRLLLELLQALDYLHRRGVVHRDLKPDNALVTPEGKLRVLDFGLAVPVDEIRQNDDLVGTLAYMAPELLRGGSHTESSDLFAVGVIAFEIFAGEHPFLRSDNVTALIMAIIGESPDVDLMTCDESVRDIIWRLLDKDPKMRYETAQDVIVALCAAANIPVPPETPAIRDSFLQRAPFIGRDNELEHLKNALHRATDFEGSVWLIGGEIGVGKSRFLDELRIQALVQGVQVLRGQSVQDATPYTLWRDPLRWLVMNTKIHELDAAILKAILPNIDALVGYDVPDIPAADGISSQQRLQSTVTSLFQRQGYPLLILLEDVQWSPESWSIIAALSEMALDLPLVVVASYRSDEAPDLNVQIPNAKHIVLERLSENNITRLSLAMLGEGGLQAEIIEFLQTQTEGNVFFVVETLRALAEEAGRLENIPNMQLPEAFMAGGIQQVMRNRLNRVAEADRAWLHAAALYGRELDLAVMTQVAYRSTVSDWLMRCANSAIIEMRDGRWQFTHDQLRLAIIETIDAADRRQHHVNLALGLASIASDTDSNAGRIASHWRQAEEPLKEFMVLNHATRHAAKVSAFAEVIAHATRALELIDAGVIKDMQEAQQARAEYQMHLAAIHKFEGQPELARQDVQAALTLFQTLENIVGIAHAQFELADIEAHHGDHEAALKWAQSSLEMSQSARYEIGIVRSLSVMGRVDISVGQFQQATEHLNASLKHARTIDDQQGIASASNSLGMSAIRQGKFDEAMTHLRDTLDIVRAQGARRSIAAVLLNLGGLAGMQERFAESTDYMEQCLQMAHEIGDRRIIAKATDNLGLLAVHQKQYDQALRYMRKSLELARKVNNQHGCAMTLTNMGHAWRGTGDVEEAEAHYLEALREGHPINATPILLEALAGLACVREPSTEIRQWITAILAHESLTEEARQIAVEAYERLQTVLPEDPSKTRETVEILQVEALIEIIIKNKEDDASGLFTVDPASLYEQQSMISQPADD